MDVTIRSGAASPLPVRSCHRASTAAPSCRARSIVIILASASGRNTSHRRLGRGMPKMFSMALAMPVAAPVPLLNHPINWPSDSGSLPAASASRVEASSTAEDPRILARRQPIRMGSRKRGGCGRTNPGLPRSPSPRLRACRIDSLASSSNAVRSSSSRAAARRAKASLVSGSLTTRTSAPLRISWITGRMCVFSAEGIRIPGASARGLAADRRSR